MLKRTFSKQLIKKPIKNLVIIFLLPIIISGSLYIFSSYRNIKVSKQNMNSTFSDKLTEFTELNKKLTNNIFQNFADIASFSPVKNVLQASTKLSPGNNLVSDAQSILGLYKQNNSIIDSVCLVNKSADTIVTQRDLATIDGFFGLQYKYEQYNTDYWKRLHVVPSSPKLLDPSEVTCDGTRKVIIPYVCSLSGSAANESYIIVNLNLEFVYNSLKAYSYTPNSQVMLMNNSSFRCLSSQGLIDFPFKNEKLKDEFLKYNFSQYNSIHMNGEDYYVMVASSTNSLYNFSYIVCVPNSDITNNTSSERTAFLLTLLIEMAIFALALLIFIFKVYKPLDYINRLTNSDSSSDRDILSRIIDYIHTSSYDMSSLKETVNELLPTGVQSYLCNLLKGNGKLDADFEKLAFKYDYFLPVSIEIVFNPKFYEDINMPYLSVQVIDIICTQFEMNHQSYCISKSATTLTVLINLQSKDDEKSVDETISSIRKIFVSDTLYISIYFGKGTLIDDLSVLSSSFEQCKGEIHSALVTERKNTSTSDQIFGHKESIQFINYLTTSNSSAAIALLDNVNARLLSASHDIVKIVYSDILFNIHRVMRQKGLSDKSYDIASDLSQITEICSNPQNEIYDYAVQCISQIGNAHNATNRKLDIEAVTKYICEHFTEDLSLDYLAEQFGTYPQYLSKRIKQYLGVTFLDYVSSLKIEKAKNLLETTDIGITEISEQSGFISRNTFLRVFKKYTGIPPSEYRKSKRDK